MNGPFFLTRIPSPYEYLVKAQVHASIAAAYVEEINLPNCCRYGRHASQE